MKNVKKLVSSILVVALLAGSAVSLSCSAFWPFSSSSRAQTAPISNAQAKKAIKEIDDYHKANPDKTTANSQAKEAVDKLREKIENMPDSKQKNELKNLIKGFDEILNLRSDLNNPNMKTRIKSKFSHLISELKNKLASLAIASLKIAVVSAIIAICYAIGIGNIASFIWSILKLVPVSIWCTLGVGIFIGKKL